VRSIDLMSTSDRSGEAQGPRMAVKQSILSSGSRRDVLSTVGNIACIP
jgi:hypothetical protein